MNKVIGYIACLLLLPVFAFAAPSITSVSGTVSGGESVTISGSSFGSNSNTGDIEWLGGASGNIESGSGTFSATGWSILNVGDDAPTYSTTQEYSGSQSVLFNRSLGDSYPDAIYFDVGEADKIYFSYWLRPYKSATTDQFKFWRWYDASGSVTDDANTIMMSKYGGSDYLTIMCNSGTGEADCYPGDDYVERYSDYNFVNNQWQRFSVYIDDSDAGSGNGTIYVVVYNDSTGGFTVARNFTTAETRGTGVTASKRYLYLQNYIGNGTDQAGTVYIDDVFIQPGTRARVELCTGSTWAARGNCSIQIPTSWSTTSISVTVNQSAYSTDDTAYLYIVDSSGDANSNGEEVTIGGESEAESTSTVSGVSVQ